MLLTLEVLPALEGDCLLLHWGTRASPRLAVIDGGPARVFDDTLLPRLEQIRADRNLDRLTLDLVMVSHVDNDHVVGIKKLFSMLARWQERHAPQDERTLQVSRLWHNTFNDILGDGADAYYRTLTASFQASIGGGPNPAIVTELERRLLAAAGADPGTARHAARDVAGVLAGHGEGRDVRVSYELLRDARQISRLNAPFEKDGRATLLTAAATPNARAIDGLGMQILGPLDTDVAALQKSFDAYIDERGLTAEATLAAYADRSVPNLSSIVCLAEAGGKRLLLTGDARGDKIIEGLRSAHLLDGEGPARRGRPQGAAPWERAEPRARLLQRSQGHHLRVLRQWQAWQSRPRGARMADRRAGPRRALHHRADLSGRRDRSPPGGVMPGELERGA
ncbi:MAG: hypothetical protein PGN34_25240 [Methylobacterium frigidaeris]